MIVRFVRVAGNSDEVVSVVPAALQGFEARCKDEKYSKMIKMMKMGVPHPGLVLGGGELCTLFDCKGVSVCSDRVDRVQ